MLGYPDIFSLVTRDNRGEHMPVLHWASYSLMLMLGAVKVILIHFYLPDMATVVQGHIMQAHSHWVTLEHCHHCILFHSGNLSTWNTQSLYYFALKVILIILYIDWSGGANKIYISRFASLMMLECHSTHETCCVSVDMAEDESVILHIVAETHSNTPQTSDHPISSASQQPNTHPLTHINNLELL